MTSNLKIPEKISVQNSNDIQTQAQNILEDLDKRMSRYVFPENQKKGA